MEEEKKKQEEELKNKSLAPIHEGEKDEGEQK